MHHHHCHSDAADPRPASQYTVLHFLTLVVALQVLCVLPILLLVGTVAVVTFHVVHDLCRRHAYTNTFFYRATPGAMDTRLSEVVEETFNPRYVWLLSAHCWRNAHLCTNAGLAKALARKYSYVSHQHRHDRWRDQHFPTLRSDQVGQHRHDRWCDTLRSDQVGQHRHDRWRDSLR